VKLRTVNRIGWLGAWMLALCAFPQVLETVESGHADGVNLTFLLLWLGGEICTFIYLLHKDYKKLIPLCFNYGMNIIFILIILMYKVVP
jgi:uncharacterized protein with PQ loop repeat